MADPANVCEFCFDHINDQFDDPGGARDKEVITGDLFVSDQCFVRDEIHFVNQGRLVFVPSGEKGEYHREYFVVCRKLIVTGGSAPGGGFNPCGPDDPGDDYRSNNVITWKDRLSAAESGQPYATPAGDGQSFDDNNWNSNSPNGNNGADGGRGGDGDSGRIGAPGRDAPMFTLVVLEIDVGGTDNLTIDFDGQNGGNAGRGQEGGKGGVGMGGRDGQSDTSWPGTGCDRQPGNGGGGGDGGNGGIGGNGGRGGNGAAISLVSTADYLAAGPFFGGKLHYINDGGSGGAAGAGGLGGRGNQKGGKPGTRTSECSEANDGSAGTDGSPTSLEAANANSGTTGPNGSGAGVLQHPLTTGFCLDKMPLPISVSTANPANLCRGFGSPQTVDVTLTGANLSQVVDVATNLANVAVTILPGGTDAQLNLRFDIAGNSATGQGDLTLTPGFGVPVTQSNIITVERFEVTAVTPDNGNKNSQVAVTISGTCFDATASLQQINISGAGITVLNPIVLDSTTAQCVLDIANLAPSEARDVTVKTGSLTHTLIGGFTVN